MIDVEIDKRKVDKTLAKLAKNLERPSALFRTWGAAVAKKARENARAKGGKHFWREIAQATRLRKVTNESALVASNHPVAIHKELGGIIKPKNKKALTIPISEEAKGKTVGDFKMGGRELFTIPGRSPETTGILGYSDENEFHGLFVLRTKVTQKADPWWPTDREVSDMGVQEGKFWIEKEMANAT